MKTCALCGQTNKTALFVHQPVILSGRTVLLSETLCSLCRIWVTRPEAWADEGEGRFTLSARKEAPL